MARTRGPARASRAKGRQASAEEVELWRHTMRGVESRGQKFSSPPGDGGERPRTRAAREPERAPSPARKPEAQAAQQAGEARAGQMRVLDVKPGQILEVKPGKSPGLDRRSALKLKRGAFRIEDRLDLHGFTRAQAHARLDDFIRDSFEAGKRCVLVITGKGWGSGFARDGVEGVLRRAVPRWLNAPALRPLILALDQAQPRHGGSGALYVLIKKKR